MAPHEVAEWLAPAATMIAAMMTASNLGARLTGWGFAVFTLGSLCWILIGLESDQTGLVVTNGFLTLVNAVGVWRWLGRQARYEEVAKTAEDEACGAAPVVRVAGLIGRDVLDRDGQSAGEIVEAMVDCSSASVAEIIVRVGGVAGVGEHMVSLAMADVRLGSDTIRVGLSAEEIAALPHLDQKV
ncbi:photosystem reaction center subunit H [Polymorphobacter multimanifer]|uniref:Sporulation protein YlmC with PRC-barrel domain n=1 Tax=Polymorphobacter multimanifer TaxID=1070431 RepID=A0A841L0E3_9SPHN|nr:PRC-barrel domain-containing protein [Polymorphobacter multimanifer]MBB6226147.1 sporulation protein YlmC with PRC-barrel domain [Polymorphobacter multimanifer]GGI72077.1 photosystem reaction center subunit H [Polymorphobacter multimanifer]